MPSGRRRGGKQSLALHSSDGGGCGSEMMDDEDDGEGGKYEEDEVRRLRDAPVAEDPDFEAAFAEMAAPSTVSSFPHRNHTLNASYGIARVTQ